MSAVDPTAPPLARLCEVEAPAGAAGEEWGRPPDKALPVEANVGRELLSGRPSPKLGVACGGAATGAGEGAAAGAAAGTVGLLLAGPGRGERGTVTSSQGNASGRWLSSSLNPKSIASSYGSRHPCRTLAIPVRTSRAGPEPESGPETSVLLSTATPEMGMPCDKLNTWGRNA